MPNSSEFNKERSILDGAVSTAFSENEASTNDIVDVTLKSVVFDDEGTCVQEAVIETIEKHGQEFAHEGSNPIVVLGKEDFDILINTFRAHYDALLRTIKVTKEKDQTIAKITKELQKYREGFSKGLVKPIAISLISFLEDSKKTLREIDSYAKSKENVVKYLDFTVSDMDSILELYDITHDAGVFMLKGKPLFDYEDISVSTIPEEKQTVEIEPIACEEKNPTLASAIEFMKSCEERVEKEVANNRILDANLELYREVVSTADSFNSSSTLMPIYRNLAKLYRNISTFIGGVKEELDESGENADYKSMYIDALEFIIDNTENLLAFMQVNTVDDVNDEFNNKTSKISSVVNTDNPDLDKKVCARLTSCYEFDGTVLYYAKVSVYKFVQQ